jgi:hypothetical protein
LGALVDISNTPWDYADRENEDAADSKKLASSDYSGEACG